MVKQFLALKGYANSGKTIALITLVYQNEGIRIMNLLPKTKVGKMLFKFEDKKETQRSKFFVCKVNAKTVFVIDSSPQERGGDEKVIATLKDDLKFIEKVANIFNSSDYTIISAFTMPKQEKKLKMKIINAEDEIKKNFDYDSIEQKYDPIKKEYSPQLLSRIKNHKFFT